MVADEIILRAKITEIQNRIGSLVVRRAMQLVPFDTGRLAGSLNFRIEGNKIIIFSDVEYAEDMEYGSPPGVLSENEREDVTGWAKRKGIKSAYGVIKKIEREGIKVGTVTDPLKTYDGRYRPFIRPAIHQSMPEIKQMISKILTK